jgi:hypothetical protein
MDQELMHTDCSHPAIGFVVYRLHSGNRTERTSQKNINLERMRKPQGCPFYGTLSFMHRYSLERL